VTVLPRTGVPYYCQYESPELVGRIADGSLPAAADPRWAASGARTPAEYEFWSRKVCGLACLKMILAARRQPVLPTMSLVHQALAAGAYVPDGDRVRGLIYQPFAEWVARDYGIDVLVVPGLPAADLCAHVRSGAQVIASVHPWIRWPDRSPRARGGHLVLVTGAADGTLRLHNPSGLPGVSQQDAMVTVADFARFFAGRGMVVAG
jgi:hypothetical protein